MITPCLTSFSGNKEYLFYPNDGFRDVLAKLSAFNGNSCRLLILTTPNIE